MATARAGTSLFCLFDKREKELGVRLSWYNALALTDPLVPSPASYKPSVEMVKARNTFHSISQEADARESVSLRPADATQ